MNGSVPAGAPRIASLSELLGEVARRAEQASGSDRPAIVDGADLIGHDELVGAARRFAAGLAVAGVGAGDVVLVQLPNWWEVVAVLLGTWERGAVACPVVSIYREHELDFIVAQIRPSVVVVPAEHRRCDHVAMLRGVAQRAGVDVTLVAVRSPVPAPVGCVTFDEFGGDALPSAAVPADPNARAVVLYTSGTTSDPKGAIHSSATLLYESRSIGALARVGSGDAVYMPSPLTHITGLLYGAILPLDEGIPTVLAAQWDPADAMATIEQHRCTFSVGATPFLRGLTDSYAAAGTTSNLAVYICGGADVPPSLVRRARKVMGTRVARTYGSTELPTATMTDPYDDAAADAAADTDGRPIGPVEVRIVDCTDGVGELHVRGPELFRGYVDAALDADSFTAGGFFRTGDLASIDEAGHVTIRGRIKDVVNRGGEKFSAKDVEEVLVLHPDIDEVAVVGVPDPVMIERACAFIVLRKGAAPLAPSDLGAWLRERGLPIQKVPEHVRVVPALAKTASGKVQKFLLRREFQPR